MSKGNVLGGMSGSSASTKLICIIYKADFASFQTKFHMIQLVANSAVFNISALCSVFLQHLTMAYKLCFF